MRSYEILGINPGADDDRIRKAYLELVRQYPPERAAEQFKEIVEAYESIKSETKRVEYYLFNKEVPVKRPMEAFSFQFQRMTKRTPPSFDKMKELLRNG